MNCGLYYHVQDVKTFPCACSIALEGRGFKRIERIGIVTVIKLEMIPDFNEWMILFIMKFHQRWTKCMNHLITYYREANPSFAIIESMNNWLNQARALADESGCYIHKDKNGTIIYVGRPRIYAIRVVLFQRELRYQTEALVSEIVDFGLSSPSPILRPCFWDQKPHQGEQARAISRSRTISPIPSSRLPMNAIRASSSRARSKGWWSLFWSLIQTGAANEIKRLWSDFPFPQRHQSAFQGLLLPPFRAVYGSQSSPQGTWPDLRGMAQEVSDFPQGQDDKIIDEL